MKKRFVCVLLTLCMVLTLMSTTAFAEGAVDGPMFAPPAEDNKCGENLTWNRTGSTLTISGTGAMYDFGSSNLPPWCNKSFDHLSLSAINIENGVTSIGNYAFNGCTGDANISISSSVTSIGHSAFGSFRRLTSITIPDSVTSIGDSTFASCEELESVTLPKNLTQIESGLFDNCTSLKSVTIPNGVTSIGNFAFQETAITSIVMPTSVTSIGTGAFEDCSSLQNVYYLGSKSQWDKVSKGRDWARNSNPSMHYLEYVAAKAPTCTDTGNSEYWYYTDTNPVQYFSDSNAINQISRPQITALGHDTKHYDAKTPTCTESGWRAYDACSRGDFTTYEEVPALGHDMERTPAKEATVTEAGNIEYWHCRNCGKYFSDIDGKHEIDQKDAIIPRLSPEIIDGKDQSLTEGERKELIFRSNAAYSDFVRVELDGSAVDAQNYTVKDGSTIVTLSSNYVTTLPVGSHTLGIVSQSGTATTTITVNAKAAVVDDPPNEDPQKGEGDNKTDNPTKDTNLPQTGEVQTGEGNNVTDERTKDTNLPQTGEAQTGNGNNETNNRTTDANLPQTGDSSHAVLWFALLLVSGGALVGTVVSSKKGKRSVGKHSARRSLR